MTALLWKKKNNNKTHMLSNRNLVNLTEFYYKTDFVLLNRETFLYLCRCKNVPNAKMSLNCEGRDESARAGKMPWSPP